MRTNLLILATVASLFASCIQSECLSVEDTEIGFNAQVGAPTKSMFFGNDFSSSAMFDVWGFYSNDGSFCEFTETSTSNFMNGLTVERMSETSGSQPDAWRNRSRHYYWPIAGKVGFYALYPSGVAQVSTPEYQGRGLQIDNYTINLTNKFTDLMYAYAVGSMESTVLSVNFKHALSQVEFNAQLGQELDGYTLYITQIDVQNVDLSAQFNYVQKESNGVWSNNTDNQTESIKYSDNRMLLSESSKTYATAMVMMPQTLSNETSLRIRYSLVDNQGNVTSGELVKELASVQPQWNMSTKYSYLINLSMDKDFLTLNADITLNDTLIY